MTFNAEQEAQINQQADRRIATNMEMVLALKTIIQSLPEKEARFVNNMVYQAETFDTDGKLGGGLALLTIHERLHLEGLQKRYCRMADNLNIVFEHYAPDALIQAGRVEFSIDGRNIGVITADKKVIYELPIDVPAVSMLYPMSNSAAPFVFEALDDTSQQYFSDPSGMDDSRVRMISFVDESKGFIMLYGGFCAALVVGDQFFELTNGELASIRTLDRPFNTDGGRSAYEHSEGALPDVRY